MKLTSGVFSVKGEAELFYEYMLVLANHEINPFVVLHLELQFILLNIKHNIYLHPQFALKDDPNDNIWAYYPIVQVSPIIMEGFLIVILSIPLIDKSLQMDPYKICNLPALHLDLRIQFFYVLEGEYLVILMSGTYAAVPTLPWNLA